MNQAALEESVRAKLLETAQNFRNVRGPSNQANVCLVAAMSSVDPTFIETMLRQIPEQEVNHGEWIALALHIDHDVMLDVIAKRFGVNPAMVGVQTMIGDEAKSRETLEEAVIQNDASRVFDLALREQWITLEGWGHRSSDGLVQALLGSADRVGKKFLAAMVHRHEKESIQETLRFMSSANLNDATIQHWWPKLIAAGADPWQLDGHGSDENDSMAANAATPGHRMLLRYLDDRQAHLSSWKSVALNPKDPSRTMMAMAWCNAPEIGGRPLAWYVLSHAIVQEALREQPGVVLDMIDDMYQKGLSLTEGDMAWRPLGALLETVMVHGDGIVLHQVLEKIRAHEKIDDEASALDITWAKRWTQGVVERMDLEKMNNGLWSAAQYSMFRFEKTKQQKNEDVEDMAKRFTIVSHCLKKDARSIALPWIEQWKATVCDWLKSETTNRERSLMAKHHQERLELSAESIVVGSSSHHVKNVKPRL